MYQLKCEKCGGNCQSDRPIKECPACGTPNPNYFPPADPPADANAGGGQSTTAPGGPGPESTAPPAPAPTAPVIHPSAAPAPAAVVVEETKTTAAAIVPNAATDPAKSQTPAPTKTDLASQIENNAAKALDDVNEIATIITKSFAGTPVAMIFQLLGPAAGIGAAVLHQHLQHVGFDLSQLKPIPPLE